MKLRKFILFLMFVAVITVGPFGTQSAKANCEYPWRTYIRYFTIITNGETTTTVTQGEYLEECDGSVYSWGVQSCGGLIHCSVNITRCDPVCDD